MERFVRSPGITITQAIAMAHLRPYDGRGS